VKVTANFHQILFAVFKQITSQINLRKASSIKLIYKDSIRLIVGRLKQAFFKPIIARMSLYTLYVLQLR